MGWAEVSDAECVVVVSVLEGVDVGGGGWLIGIRTAAAHESEVALLLFPVHFVLQMLCVYGPGRALSHTVDHVIFYRLHFSSEVTLLLKESMLGFIVAFQMNVILFNIHGVALGILRRQNA